MKIIKIRRFGCERVLFVCGRQVYRWVDRNLVLRDCWKRVRFLADYICCKQNHIELPADNLVQREWTGRFDTIKMPLSALLRYEGENRIVPIGESCLTRYCQTHDVKYLKDFYRFEHDAGYTTLDEEQFVKKQQERTDWVCAGVAEGYDPAKMCIVIASNNIVIDGMHRAAAIFAQKGGDCCVTVVRVL